MSPTRLLCTLLATSALLAPCLTVACPASLDYSSRPLLGSAPVRLCDEYAGKVLLVVNTASRCAFTPQYESLEKLYERYRERGFAVLGFPSNDFGGQEPGSAEQIGDFCKTIYGVQFPMFEKTSVRGEKANPFYRHLARESGGGPKWNFHKYLIDREGHVVTSFGSFIDPDSDAMVEAIESLL
jgi:glutathione peroxidase